MQFCEFWCVVVQWYSVLCSVVWSGAVVQCTVQCSVEWCSATLFSAVQYCEGQMMKLHQSCVHCYNVNELQFTSLSLLYNQLHLHLSAQNCTILQCTVNFGPL